MRHVALTPERLAEMQDCFERALDLPREERDTYLRSVHARDEDLATRVRALLDAHARTGSELQSPVSADIVLDLTTDRRLGSHVGAYEIVRLIGFGGMGTVYEAVRADDQYRKHVAVKFLSAQATSDTAIQRFRRERQILANLAHPNIAALIDGGVSDDGQPYFVMEYIEGEPLTRWCDARLLAVPARLELFRQVCAAVQYAHQSLVVHRDLKPANILVTGDGVVKLLDFGIAKLLPSDADDSHEFPLTRAGTRAFTPDYASPEQLLGQPIGTRSDVYALGVVLYELLCGARPFELRGKSHSEIERLVSQETPTRPSVALGDARAVALSERSPTKARGRLEGDLDAVVMKALRKEPERRYGSVDELSADLGRYLGDHPVSARPDDFAYRLGKLVRRRRVETIAAVLVTASVIAAVVVSTRQARVANVERERATEVTAFLTTMLGAANPGSFGRDVKVREVLDSASVKANGLAARPELEAETRGIIGGTYLALGEFELAERQYRAAVAARERAAPNGDRATAVAIERLSMAIEFQGRYAAADTLLRSSTAMFDRFGYGNDVVRADHLDNRARILGALSKGAEAEPLFLEALAIQRKLKPRNDSALASAYTNLAVVQSDLGNNASAETLMVAAVAAAKRAYGPVHPLVAAILSPLASVQERAGAIARADSTYLEGLAMRRTLLGEEHPDYAWSMFNYADHLLSVGRYAEAAEWSRRVLRLRGRTLKDSHPAVSTSMGLLGRALARMDSLDVAEKWLRESLALRRANYEPGHYLIASSESILGEHLALRKQFPQAETLLLRSERALVAARGEKAPIVGDARKRIVAMYDAWGKSDEAARWRAKLPTS
ncbi:MAG: serine/threonine-protein kinase [bacterium]